MKRSRYVKNKHQTPWYLHDIFGIILLLIAVFILCALLSYNPYDPTWFYATTDPYIIKNWCGTIGAHVSVLLIYLFGASSIYAPIGVLLLAYECIVTKSYKRNADRILAVYILMCTSAAWCFAYQIDFLGTSFSGGIVGMYVYQTLYKILDSLGALLCIYTLLLICLILITRLSLVHCVNYCMKLMHYGVRNAIQTQPKTNAFFCTARQLYFNTASMHRTWMKKISLTLGTQKELDSEHDYPIYAHEEFDEKLYDSTGWDFEDKKAVNTTTHLASFMQSNDKQSITNTGREKTGGKPAIAQDMIAQSNYTIPDVQMFTKKTHEKADQKHMRQLEFQARLLEEKLARFGIGGSVTSIRRGPVVTLFEYQPDIDSKISKITALENDLALALQAISIRIIAPIPGKSVIGFEVANKFMQEVLFSTVIHCSAYAQSTGKLPLILGQDTVGDNVVVDLAAMPHLLVAGSTGSGKSVALNSMLMSLLCACTPDQLRLILIDPKRLEFAPYADIAHLIFPIITDPRKAVLALMWVVKEMETRYETMSKVGAKNSNEYNKDTTRQPMPYLVVIIDELADLMMTAGREIETLITRIAQMARAAGIHTIVATQRPSVDVITGLIKANFPSRISFRVASKIDSRTILDTSGADALLGRGDMLFLDSRSSSLRRVHGAYVSDQEIENVVAYIRSQKNVIYRDLIEELPLHGSLQEPKDEIYDEILAFLKEVEEISISLLQRKFRIGYNRSARIIDMLESDGLIMPSENGKLRKVIK